MRRTNGMAAPARLKKSQPIGGIAGRSKWIQHPEANRSLRRETERKNARKGGASIPVTTKSKAAKLCITRVRPGQATPLANPPLNPQLRSCAALSRTARSFQSHRIIRQDLAASLNSIPFAERKSTLLEKWPGDFTRFDIEVDDFSNSRLGE